MTSRTLLCIPLNLALIAFAAGCASTKYHYNNQKFSSADQALAKQKSDIDAILAAVQPTTTPVHGKALVALPSRDEIRKHHIRLSGNLSALRSDALDYVCVATEAEQEMLCTAIQKRAVFDQVTVVRVNEPVAAAIGENDYLLCRDIDGWFLKGRESAPEKVPMAASVSPGLPWTRAFLDSVERCARGLTK